jgi:hypothetical protein
MEHNIFLDLEETIIESWQNPVLVNSSRMKDWLEDKRVTEIGIFSFAILNEADLHVFNKDIKPMLETRLAVTISKVFTVEEVCLIIRKNFGAFWEPDEIPLIWGKTKAFVDVCTATMPRGSTCVLIDDVVDDMSIHNTTKDLIIKTINIKTI